MSTTTTTKTTQVKASKANIGVFTNPDHRLWIDSAEPSLESVQQGSPELKEGEVTVAIRSTGICGSDVHFWKHGCIGPMIVTCDHVLGHESAGEIIAVHPSVKTLQVGDRVAIEPQVICNECEPCLTGRYNGCERVDFLSTPPVAGLLRRYVNHKAVWCHKIGDMSYEDGAMLEPLSVALAGMQRAGVRLGDPVLICGAGPIGLITLLCCQAAGACPLVITDIDEGRLKFAREIAPGVVTVKVEPGLNVEQQAERIVREGFKGIEPAVALECTGVESSIGAAIWAMKFGGKVFVIGVGRNEIQIPFMRASVREVDLQFQYRYSNTWPRAIRLVQNKVVDLSRLVTHRFPLEEALKAFDTASDPKTGAIKIVRFESTATQKAAETAKQTASKAQAQAAEFSAKAQEGLSRVTAAAGPAITNAAKNVSGALGKVGGPTGRIVAFVESKTPTLVYYTKVGIEVAKIVFRGQSMSPPSVSTFQTYFQNLWKQLQTPGPFFSQLAKSLNPQQVRNLSRTQVAAGGVLLAELLGFFTVGEMIGRLKIVGYHGGQSAAAHH
ncbi:putative sorbitol dehydrogenase [Triangularia setosa]|uniref:L-arabinitol 4-dehydrogenase n=1 Tax=Triangularia setosa TaxID=2587417 RepID=A0AAN7ACJ8_9PEZI|nr:putative sorbitol dehydrogenase [Podospora setosa]